MYGVLNEPIAASVVSQKTDQLILDKIDLSIRSFEIAKNLEDLPPPSVENEVRLP
jgi:hypothetical protein